MIVLQIYFAVPAEKAAGFELMYQQAYAPALRKQTGYQGSRLLRIFPPAVAAQIEAAASEYNYQMELAFDSEENRRRWAASAEHQVVWPQAQALAEKVAWRGYDIAGADSVAF